MPSFNVVKHITKMNIYSMQECVIVYMDWTSLTPIVDMMGNIWLKC